MFNNVASLLQSKQLMTHVRPAINWTQEADTAAPWRKQISAHSSYPFSSTFHPFLVFWPLSCLGLFYPRWEGSKDYEKLQLILLSVCQQLWGSLKKITKSKKKLLIITVFVYSVRISIIYVLFSPAQTLGTVFQKCKVYWDQYSTISLKLIHVLNTQLYPSMKTPLTIPVHSLALDPITERLLCGSSELPQFLY